MDPKRDVFEEVFIPQFPDPQPALSPSHLSSSSSSSSSASTPTSKKDFSTVHLDISDLDEDIESGAYSYQQVPEKRVCVRFVCVCVSSTFCVVYFLFFFQCVRIYLHINLRADLAPHEQPAPRVSGRHHRVVMDGTDEDEDIPPPPGTQEASFHSWRFLSLPSSFFLLFSFPPFPFSSIKKKEFSSFFHLL